MDFASVVTWLKLAPKIALLCCTALLFAGCAGETTGPPLQPTATVQELMAHMIDPAADVFWDAVGTIITEDSVDHWEPRTEEEWTVIRHAALTLTEAGNLLMIGDRARDQDAWMRMVQGMTDSGHKALQAVEGQLISPLTVAMITKSRSVGFMPAWSSALRKASQQSVNVPSVLGSTTRRSRIPVRW